MQSLRRLNLSNIEVKEMALALHESNGVILEYDSLEDFKANFNKYILVLRDFKEKIKAVSSLSSGQVFEGTVFIMSELEDKIDIPISTLFIDAKHEKAISDLADFYFDDLNDGSFELNIVNAPGKTPFNIIEWILMSNINCGVNLALDMENTAKIWYGEEEIFDSIYPYLSSLVYKDHIMVVK